MGLGLEVVHPTFSHLGVAQCGVLSLSDLDVFCCFSCGPGGLEGFIRFA